MEQYLRRNAEEAATDHRRKQADASRPLEATQNQLKVHQESLQTVERCRRRKGLEEAEQCRTLLDAARRAVAAVDNGLNGLGQLHGEPLRWADGQWQAVVESVDYLIMRLRSIETETGVDRDPGRPDDRATN